MTEKKNWGHTVLGWFVVKEGGETGELGAPGAAPPLPAEEAAPLPPPPQMAFVKEPPKAKGGDVDFDAVFDAAGIDAAERDLFAKAQALLGGLPPGTDPAVKRQIVEASLKAFGIPIEKIIESGAGSIQALEAYIQKGAADTASFAQDVRTLIEGYETKIREARELLDKKLADQASVQTRCNERKLEVQRVLEFFGQDAVARVVQASPKLIDPAAPAERKG
jgi:hypothetical protein